MRWSDGEDLYRLLRSCVGARGRPKLLLPSSVVTSSSQRLLPLLALSSSPFARIVRKAAGALEDGGLTCFLLAFLLASDPPLAPRPLVGALHDHFSAEFLLILETQVAWKVDFRELHPLQCLVRTLLSSKPACTLTRVDSEVVCNLVLAAFLQGGRVGVMPVGTGLAPCHSKVVPGVGLPIGERDEERIQRMLPDAPFRACLFTCSLAGEVKCPAARVLATSEEAVEGASLTHLSHLIEEVGARLLLCQKVVHPCLKKRLHGAGVVVVDRIGGENAASVRTILGEEMIGNAWCGTLSRPSIACLGRSRFLLLSTTSSGQCSSLLLTHHNQEALAELEVVCRQSLSALFRLLAPLPRLCFGGGCSEITAAVLLTKKVRDSLDSTCSVTSCNPGLVLCSLESFVRGIAHLCASIHQGHLVDLSTDSEGGHLWRQCPPADRCACGTRDASSVKDWKRLSDIAGLGGLLQTSVSQNYHSLRNSSVSASIPVNNLVPSVHQSVSESCYVPQTLSTSRLAYQNDTVSVPVSSTPRLVQQNDIVSVSVSQTLSTSPLAQQNDTVSVSAPQTLSTCRLTQMDDPVFVPQAFLSLAQNARQVSNPSTSDNVLGNSGREILLDEFLCKRNSLSIAFETSSMLLKTTEYIHTSPITTAAEEKKKVDV